MININITKRTNIVLLNKSLYGSKSFLRNHSLRWKFSNSEQSSSCSEDSRHPSVCTNSEIFLVVKRLHSVLVILKHSVHFVFPCLFMSPVCSKFITAGSHKMNNLLFISRQNFDPEEIRFWLSRLNNTRVHILCINVE